eukprot:GHVL01022538.1.p1 GENE.GHVL01022538.1~~GHVL01022538.1.p1  ORF type:complete len:1181 (-),score=134.10 GHVL01022538.1:184-3726(-)
MTNRSRSSQIELFQSQDKLNMPSPYMGELDHKLNTNDEFSSNADEWTRGGSLLGGEQVAENAWQSIKDTKDHLFDSKDSKLVHHNQLSQTMGTLSSRSGTLWDWNNCYQATSLKHDYQSLKNESSLAAQANSKVTDNKYGTIGMKFQSKALDTFPKCSSKKAITPMSLIAPQRPTNRYYANQKLSAAGLHLMPSHAGMVSQFYPVSSRSITPQIPSGVNHRIGEVLRPNFNSLQSGHSSFVENDCNLTNTIGQPLGAYHETLGSRLSIKNIIAALSAENAYSTNSAAPAAKNSSFWHELSDYSPGKQSIRQTGFIRRRKRDFPANQKQRKFERQRNAYESSEGSPADYKKKKNRRRSCTSNKNKQNYLTYNRGESHFASPLSSSYWTEGECDSSIITSSVRPCHIFGSTKKNGCPSVKSNNNSMTGAFHKLQNQSGSSCWTQKDSNSDIERYPSSDSLFVSGRIGTQDAQRLHRNDAPVTSGRIYNLSRPSSVSSTAQSPHDSTKGLVAKKKNNTCYLQHDAKPTENSASEQYLVRTNQRSSGWTGLVMDDSAEGQKRQPMLSPVRQLTPSPRQPRQTQSTDNKPHQSLEENTSFDLTNNDVTSNKFQVKNNPLLFQTSSNQKMHHASTTNSPHSVTVQKRETVRNDSRRPESPINISYRATLNNGTQNASASTTTFHTSANDLTTQSHTQKQYNKDENRRGAPNNDLNDRRKRESLVTKDTNDLENNTSPQDQSPSARINIYRHMTPIRNIRNEFRSDCRRDLMLKSSSPNNDKCRRTTPMKEALNKHRSDRDNDLLSASHSPRNAREQHTWKMNIRSINSRSSARSLSKEHNRKVHPPTANDRNERTDHQLLASSLSPKNNGGTPTMYDGRTDSTNIRSPNEEQGDLCNKIKAQYASSRQFKNKSSMTRCKTKYIESPQKEGENRFHDQLNYHDEYSGQVQYPTIVEELDIDNRTSVSPIKMSSRGREINESQHQESNTATSFSKSPFKEVAKNSNRKNDNNSNNNSQISAVKEMVQERTRSHATNNNINKMKNHVSDIQVNTASSMGNFEQHSVCGISPQDSWRFITNTPNLFQSIPQWQTQNHQSGSFSSIYPPFISTNTAPPQRMPHQGMQRPRVMHPQQQNLLGSYQCSSHWGISQPLIKVLAGNEFPRPNCPAYCERIFQGGPAPTNLNSGAS